MRLKLCPRPLNVVRHLSSKGDRLLANIPVSDHSPPALLRTVLYETVFGTSWDYRRRYPVCSGLTIGQITRKIISLPQSASVVEQTTELCSHAQPKIHYCASTRIYRVYPPRYPFSNLRLYTEPLGSLCKPKLTAQMHGVVPACPAVETTCMK